jgi:uncharacterized protein YkwD
MRRRHPILLAVATAGTLAVCAPAASARACTGAAAAVRPASASLASAEGATLCLVNQERQRRGLRPLRANARLRAAARDHSRDMVRRGYFEHGAFDRRIARRGYAGGRSIWTLGENIAWGTGELASASQIVDAWMHSPGHRENILYPGFRDAGVGVAPGVPDAAARGQGGATYTLDFGTRR